MIIVPAAGKIPNDVLICGEAPGRVEARKLIPFVGPTGQLQSAHLARHGLNVNHFRRTNVIPLYLEGDPDPTPDLITEWTPYLVAEIARCRPRLIVAVGAFAARWFLGSSADLFTCHGLPHKPGAFDPSIANRVPHSAHSPHSPDCCILPIYHPAAGLHNYELRREVRQDYDQVAAIYHLIRTNQPIPYRQDPYAGKESYHDVTGAQLASLLTQHHPPLLALDTEGIPGSPWSIQVSWAPGTGYLLRYSQPDFALGVAALQSLANNSSDTTFILHDASTPSGTGYDVRMCREMGLELRRARQFNTMYAAYLLRTESKSLKTLGYRWCGAEMADYESIIGDIGRQKQILYLSTVASEIWPRLEPTIVHENDGTYRLYRPQPLHQTVERILADIASGKVTKEGPTDPYKRWGQIDPTVRRPAEEKYGPIPVGNLDDLPLSEAIQYSCKDADITFRLKPLLESEIARRESILPRRGLSRILSDGNLILPVFEEMQATGMPAVKSHFIKLEAYLQSRIDVLQQELSTTYYSGKPFNPGSNPQVASLLRRRGLQSTKRTKTGAVSTSKQAIEHLRFKDPAIGLVFDCRELQHIRDSFCRDVVARIPDGHSTYSIRCAIDPANVHTRRLASSNPNFLATPTRTEIGRKIRDGYQVSGNRVFASWDYSQIEARVLAHVSGDDLLCRLFNESRDIHIETAAMIFDRTVSDIAARKDLRDSAKTINYGIVYGQGPPGLATQLRMRGLEGWDEDKCRLTLRKWFQVYRGVKQFSDLTTLQLKRDECVCDLWGMPRYLPAINSGDPKLAAEASREAVSHIVSGTAQGMIQRAIIHLAPIITSLQDLGLDILWHLEVHDELILSFDEDLWPMMNDLVTDALVNHCGIRLSVPVKAEGHMSKSWGGLK